jgi:hypothetical protein
VEGQASYSPIKLRITSLCTCQHNIKYEEGEQYTEYSDELQHGSRANVAVLILFRRLNKLGDHYAETKKITYVGKVYVEIPTKHIDIVENSKAGNTAHQTERAVYCLIDQLCRSAFYHDISPLFLLK